eukprot:gene20038-23983_t
MNPFLAQALTIEGIIQFTMNKQREVWYDAHQATNPVVEHYKPWLRLEANHLAQVVALPTPYPEQVGIATRVDGAVRTYMVNCPNEAARQIVDRAEAPHNNRPPPPLPAVTMPMAERNTHQLRKRKQAPHSRRRPPPPPPAVTMLLAGRNTHPLRKSKQHRLQQQQRHMPSAAVGRPHHTPISSSNSNNIVTHMHNTICTSTSTVNIPHK